MKKTTHISRTHTELTEPLKLIQKLMQDIKAPLRNQIQRIPLLLLRPLLGSLAQDQIEQLPVRMPPLDPIPDRRTFHRLQMTEGQLVIESKEQFITRTFGGDGIGSRPGGSGEVLGRDVAEGKGVERVLFGGDEGAAGDVVEVKDAGKGMVTILLVE
jgi:hypothetical protein